MARARHGVVALVSWSWSLCLCVMVRVRVRVCLAMGVHRSWLAQRGQVEHTWSTHKGCGLTALSWVTAWAWWAIARGGGGGVGGGQGEWHARLLLVTVTLMASWRHALT